MKYLAAGQLLRRLLVSAVLMGVVLASGAGAILPVRQADAATVYCWTPMHVGNESGVHFANYIDLYADPACSGNRYAAYDFYGTTNIQMDLIFIDFARAWLCGSLSMDAQDLYGWNTGWANIWSGWSPKTTCGFQADQQIRFFKSGTIDRWTYANV